MRDDRAESHRNSNKHKIRPLTQYWTNEFIGPILVLAQYVTVKGTGPELPRDTRHCLSFNGVRK